MSKIKCSQEKCKYNNCQHCMLEGIQVNEKTNCTSYKEGPHKQNLKFEFASFEIKENHINCNATQCLYNKNTNCTINHLNIGKNQNEAPCIDFEKRN